MRETCSKQGVDDKLTQHLSPESEGQRPLGRPRRRRKYNIKTDLKEMRCGVEWVQLARVPLACPCEHDNQTFGFHNRRELDYMRNYQLLKKNGASRS